MKARDIMTTEVVSVKPGAGVAEIAELMTKHRISGLPVVNDDGAIVGIISETDLLHRAETGTPKHRKWWIRVFADKDMLARDFVKAHATKAADIMSRFVVTVSENASLAQVADLLDANDLKRVPVLRDGRLAGMITRGDLVKALVRAKTEHAAEPGDNGSVQKRLMEAIQRQPWVQSAYLNVTVEDDRVDLRGFVGTEQQHKALRILVEEQAGNRRLDDNIVIGMRWLASAT